jgi:hypothetical protein
MDDGTEARGDAAARDAAMSAKYCILMGLVCREQLQGRRKPAVES